MFDDSHVDAPGEFRTDRSNIADYLHFGAGLHTCAGQYISRLLILEVTKQLLSITGLRRAAGAEGEIRSDGPFPDSFSVEFDRANTDISEEKLQ
jgi:cytochrome P450